MQALIFPSSTSRQYTQHAAQRCLERGISSQRVEQAIDCGELRQTRPDAQIYAHGRLRVVFNPSTNTVVTTFMVPRRNPKRCIQRQRTELRQYQRDNRFHPCF